MSTFGPKGAGDLPPIQQFTADDPDPLPVKSTSTELLEDFNNQGCLIRMVGDVDKEFEAYDTISNSADPFDMVRPATLIQKDLPVSLYGGGHGFAVLYRSNTPVSASYKRMTFSNSIPNWINEFNELKDHESLDRSEFLLSKLNAACGDGGSTNLKASRNFKNIKNLFNKVMEQEARSKGTISDVNTKTRLYDILKKFDGGPLADLKPFLLNELKKSELPIFIKKQVSNKLESYLNDGHTSADSIIKEIGEHRALKGADWELISRSLYDINTEISMTTQGPELIEIKTPKDGTVSLHNFLDSHQMTTASKNRFLYTVAAGCDIKNDFDVSYDELRHALESLSSEQKNRGISPKVHSPQYMNKCLPEHRVVMLNEVLARPTIENIQGIHIKPGSTNIESLNRALKFHQKLAQKGKNVDFFSYDPDAKNRLTGPFDLKELLLPILQSECTGEVNSEIQFDLSENTLTWVHDNTGLLREYPNTSVNISNNEDLHTFLRSLSQEIGKQRSLKIEQDTKNNANDATVASESNTSVPDDDDFFG